MDTTRIRTRLLLCCVALICGGCRAAQVAGENATIIKDLSELRAHYLPAAYAQSNFSLADAQRLLHRKCQKANAMLTDFNATAMGERIELAARRLLECANSLANITQVLDEMEVARPHGDLDVVFEKYCKRMPQAEQCLQDFNTALLPCLTREERAQNTVLMRIVSRLLGFVCDKNGDRIALFIAEEGPECLEQNKEHIANCMNATFASYVPKEVSAELQDLPDLVVGARQCIDLHDFEKCVLGHLDLCNTITPSNIVESLFRYVRKESKCQPDIDRAVRERADALRLAGGGQRARDAAAGIWTGGVKGLVLLPLLAVLAFLRLR